MNDSIRIQLPDGRTTSGRWDDIETGNLSEKQAPKIIVDEKLNEAIHELPENWLRARVRGWMNLNESPDQDWWVGTYTADGRWIWASSNQDTYTPLMHRVEFARRVCRFINKNCAHGGAWLAGWIRGGHEFYLLWKDPDGDIQIPLEFGQPFTVLNGWTNNDIAEHCEQAHAVWVEWHRNLDKTGSQEKKLAQGEQVSAANITEGPAIAGLETKIA